MLRCDLTDEDRARIDLILRKYNIPECGHPDCTDAEVVATLAKQPGSDWLYETITKIVGRAPYLAARGETSDLSVSSPLGRRYDEPTPQERRAAAVRPPYGKPDTRVIVFVMTPNPKRKGSKSHAYFEMYRAGISLDDARKAGVPRSHILDDLRHGYIRVR